jgi:hypothetical protein
MAKPQCREHLSDGTRTIAGHVAEGGQDRRSSGSLTRVVPGVRTPRGGGLPLARAIVPAITPPDAIPTKTSWEL